MRIITFFTSIAVVLLLSSISYSQSAIESFDYPSGVMIDTLVGTAGNGWGGAWDHFDGATEVMTVADTGFVYDDLNYPVPHAGRFLIGANPAAWSTQRWGRYLDQTWPNEAGKIYWMSTIYELRNFTDNGWAGVGLWIDSTEQANTGHEWGNDSLGLFQYNVEGHSPYLSHSGAQWLVVKIIMTGDTLGNRVLLWVSPDPAGAEPDTNLADARGFWRMDRGFNRVVVHFGGEGVGMTMAVDEIRLGTTWASVSSTITGINENTSIPDKFELKQNYPNPFNPATSIIYSVKSGGKVRLSVYDLMGREVSVLVNEVQNAGSHIATFSAETLASGIYFYRLQSADGVILKKMTLLK